MVAEKRQICCFYFTGSVLTGLITVSLANKNTLGVSSDGRIIIPIYNSLDDE